jgi:Pyridoxamine 5'-phosphate oxidase like
MFASVARCVQDACKTRARRDPLHQWVITQRLVSIAGQATVQRDQAKIDELWNPSLRMWFEGGPTDPELVLVHVQSHHASYWDSPVAPVRWFQFLAGLATGKRPAGDAHGTVELDRS